MDKLYVAEREHNCNTTDEAMELLKNEYNHEKFPIKLEQVTFDEDINLCVDGNKVNMTEWAFESLLKMLGIPVSFGKKIPKDLLRTIVHRLKEEADSKATVIRQGNDVWNFIKKDQGIKLDEIIPLTGKINAPYRIKVGIRGVIIDTEMPIVPIEPEVGDVVKFGLRTEASETGGPKPVASLMLYRLACLNGAVMGEDFGQIRWGRGSDYTIAEFSTDMAVIGNKANELGAVLKALPHRKLNDMTFHYVWNSVRKVLHDETGIGADTLLQVNEEERDAYIASSAHRKAKLLAAGPTEVNAWNAYNKVSELARDLKYKDNQWLSRVAGDILMSTAGPNLAN
jgi:hypothetical protein